MKLKTLLIGGMVISALGAFTGCQSTGGRMDLDTVTKTAAIGPEDVRETVADLVDSMLGDQDFLDEYCKGRPVLDVAQIQNRSSMHLDMRSITDSMRTKLVRSRKFKFVDHTSAETDIYFSEGAATVNADPSKVVQMGQQSAAQLYIYGALSEMRQQVGGVTDRYYKFTLNVKDLKTGELAWTDEKEIRKFQKKSAMGL